MTNKKIYHLTLLVLFFIFPFHFIQGKTIDNWQARPSLSVKYKLNNKWSVTGTYYQYFDNNVSKFDKSVFGAKVGYKLSDQVSVGGDYRWTISSNNNYHDLRYSLLYTPDLNLDKWSLAYQIMLQQKLTNGLRPDHYLRNLFQVEYQISSRFSLFALTENYLDLYHGIEHNTQKYALGGDIAITSRSKISLQLTIKDRHKQIVYARPEISYSYSF